VADASRSKRVYLHIGAPKTGTTYLQAILSKNRKTLADKGILYPESLASAHHKAVWDLRGTPPQREGLAGIEGSWQALVDVADAARTDVLVSSEHFVFAHKPQIKRAVTAFDAEVHVIYTARDLVRQVPAVWQERVKNQKSMTYRAFIASVMNDEGRMAKAFWNAQDVGSVLRRWSADLAPTRMHLVTAPPTGQPYRVLWDRFARVLGLTGTDFDVEVDGSSNVSLSMIQTEVLRRFNERFAEALTWQQYRRLIFRQLDVLRAIGDGRRISLTQQEQRFFAGKAAEIADLIVSRGYDVVGDLADLTPAVLEDAAQSSVEEPTELSDGELLGASLDVLRELLDRQADAKAAARGGKRIRSGDPINEPS
jgi:hypothetical protein